MQPLALYRAKFSTLRHRIVENLKTATGDQWSPLHAIKTAEFKHSAVYILINNQVYQNKLNLLFRHSSKLSYRSSQMLYRKL